MQSDFLRVHWILKNGGVYSDLTFAPQNNPKFWAEDDQLVCVKWHHGLIVNGIFYAKPEAELLLRIAERIQFNVKNQIGNNILQVTGPGVWREVLSNETDKRFSLIKKSDLFAKFIRHSHYSFSTRNTQNHWSEMQKTESIYRDVKNG
ncbi:hypothetical protein DZD18_10550 [Rhodobacteraceae bacterium W635]|nr:hypothetical protein DZD18_10550 [Rhodobacteraceae bacterium W635]